MIGHSPTRPARRRAALWAFATRRCAALVVLAAAATALSACGVAVESAPRTIPRSQVPFHLLAPAGSTPSTVPTAIKEVVYFLTVSSGTQLTPVTRYVAAPVGLRSIMQSLVEGPTSSELNSGVSTAISPAVQVLSATVNDGVATVDFSEAIAGGTAQIPAVAQVVYTATDQPGVHEVRFEIDGDPTNVPTANSTLASGPVTRADYPSPLP